MLKTIDDETIFETYKCRRQCTFMEYKIYFLLKIYKSDIKAELHLREGLKKQAPPGHGSD